MNEKLIQVLWVEDDPKVTSTYPLEAYQYGIQLVPFCCWEDAEKALETEFKRWSAIVLDAKCKYKRESHDNATQFLTQAIHAIDTICASRHHILPWYVLSGGSEEELNDLIIDSREEWDGDWKGKKYYSKATDRDFLFRRILRHAQISPEMQIRLIYYPDVFKAIRNSKLDASVEVYMEDLLLPIHLRKYTGEEYNNNMHKVRKCIELIFQSMAQHGILPNKKYGDKSIIHDILRSKIGNGINITWCSLILSGKEIKQGENVLVTSENILPNVLKDSFQRLIEITAAYVHANDKSVIDKQRAKNRHTEEFLASIGNAPYLLCGMVMELCNIILWYDSYLKEHSDEKNNTLNWKVIDKQC